MRKLLLVGQECASFVCSLDYTKKYIIGSRIIPTPFAMFFQTMSQFWNKLQVETCGGVLLFFFLYFDISVDATIGLFSWYFFSIEKKMYQQNTKIKWEVTYHKLAQMCIFTINIFYVYIILFYFLCILFQKKIIIIIIVVVVIAILALIIGVSLAWGSWLRLSSVSSLHSNPYVLSLVISSNTTAESAESSMWKRCVMLEYNTCSSVVVTWNSCQILLLSVLYFPDTLQSHT